MPDHTDPLTLVPPPADKRRGEQAAPPPAQGLARDAFGREIEAPIDNGPGPAPEPEAGQARREPATATIGTRAGALSDELDFPAFVASLVHGTFDAMVDASIRQMESFADLVAAVAKPVEQFAHENVSLNQARDWLIERYPRDLTLVREEGEVRVVSRAKPGSEGEEPTSPEWLADFSLQGEELTTDLIEEQLLPQARQQVAHGRLQTLATMVLLGMNRVVVKDGTIAARLRFRAAAADHAKVDYAVSDDAGAGSEWGQRGSRTYAQPSTKVSTVGINVQSDSELKSELFGEVKINFASETVPLDRFVDEARRTILERHARTPRPGAQRTVATAPPAPAERQPVEPAAPPDAPGQSGGRP